MKLHSIGPDSAQLLSDLSIATFEQAYEDLHSPEDLRAYSQQHYSVSATAELLKQASVQAVVAVDEQGQDNRPAGFYLLKQHQCPVAQKGQCSELKQIYVLSDYYGIGLGAELFAHALHHVRKRRSDWLWLCVSDKNFRAQAFYQKLGFERVGEGPMLQVGKDTLSSSIMLLKL